MKKIENPNKWIFTIILGLLIIIFIFTTVQVVRIWDIEELKKIDVKIFVGDNVEPAVNIPANRFLSALIYLTITSSMFYPLMIMSLLYVGGLWSKKITRNCCYKNSEGRGK